MMKNISIYLCLICFLSINANASENFSKENWDTAYSRRDFKLGINLQEFRKRPPPSYNSFTKGIQLKCSNDKDYEPFKFSQITLTNNEKKIGIIKCHPSFTYERRIRPAKIGIADILAFTTFYFLKPKGQNEHYLYQIRTLLPKRYLAEFVLLYELASKQKPTTLIPNQLFTFSNKSSTITIAAPSITELFSITHELKSLISIYDKRERNVMIEKSKKL